MKRIIFYFSLFALVLNELLLWWLFPYTGLGGIYAVLIFLFFMVLLIVIQFFTKKSKTFNVLWAFQIVLLLVSIYVCWVTFPSDINQYPSIEVKKYWKVYRAYPEELKFTDLISKNHAVKVAAIRKYQGLLPDQIKRVVLSHKNSSGIYYISIKNDSLSSFDKNLIINKIQDTLTFKIKNDTIPSYKISFRNFYNNEGYFLDTISIYPSSVNLNPERGIESVFYKILN